MNQVGKVDNVYRKDELWDGENVEYGKFYHRIELPLSKRYTWMKYDVHTDASFEMSIDELLEAEVSYFAKDV